MVDSIKSNRDEDYEEAEEEAEEEVDEPDQGFEFEQVDQVIEVVPSFSPIYENMSPAGEIVDQAADIQLKALYEGEGVSPPHYDERAPIGPESEDGDEEDEDEGFQQQNFVTNDMLFMQESGAVVTEYRETLDLGTSSTQQYYRDEEHFEQKDDEEEREAEGQL